MVREKKEAHSSENLRLFELFLTNDCLVKLERDKEDFMNRDDKLIIYCENFHLEKNNGFNWIKL